MSQAEALLANVALDDVTPHASQYVEVEPHIVIGIDRFITVPNELKRIAVQYDHNMRTVTFDCPRYYDGRDMSTMKVYINYKNLNDPEVIGSYIADNVVVDDLDSTVMHFDWTIKNTVTPSKGTLAILICVRRTDSNGNEENHWNSELNSDLHISEGMEFNSETIKAQYPDIVTQLLERMDRVEDLATPEAMQGYANAWLEENSDEVLAEIQAKGEEVLATIPADYTETFNLAAEAHADARTKADAIIRTVGGSIIAVADSSDDYLRGLRVFGKTKQVKTTGAQMIPSPYFDKDKTINGVKWTVRSDGALVAAGTANANSPFYLTGGSYQFAEGTYTISGSTGKVILRVDASDISTGEWAKAIATSRGGTPTTFTISAEDVASYQFTVYAMVENGNSANVAIYPMLNSGSTAHPYEVYTGNAPAPSPDYPQDLVNVTNPNVCIYNKNLLNVEDKDITTTGAYYYDIPTEFEPVIGETYTLSADAEFDTLPCLFSIGCGNRAYHNEMNQTQVEIAKSGRVSITFTWRLTEAQIASGYTKLAFRLPRYSDKIAFNAKVSNIQLELGTVATEYEPHKEQEVNTPRTLPGIPVTSGGNYTDENGQQWICDEVDFERGVYAQRVYQRTFDGVDGETITLYSERNHVYGFAIKITDVNMLKTSHAAMCTHFENIETGISSVDKECYLCGAGSTTIYVMVSKERIAEYSIDAFKAWLSENPITIVFQLATPVETSLTAEELAAFQALRTNYHNTTVLNEAGAYMEMSYVADTKTYVDGHGASDEQIKDAVNAYFEENPVQAGMTESDLYRGVTMSDRTTGKKYVVYIDNGKLTMAESEG